ncbi:hypothetical protein BTA31_12260 [Bacillus haynesii]|uniref:Uncharacterized protein n=1 Tax=Bacillus haynesii TaxID=1925021 RepID=A0ABX3I6G0_9BACI|nr:hypothetical protein BTA31_12260 [Bacillus haynesii]
MSNTKQGFSNRMSNRLDISYEQGGRNCLFVMNKGDGRDFCQDASAGFLEKYAVKYILHDRL